MGHTQFMVLKNIFDLITFFRGRWLRNSRQERLTIVFRSRACQERK